MITLDKEQIKCLHRKLLDATGGLDGFVDGNKRIGTYVMMVLLELNKLEIDFSDADVVRMGLDLASGKMTDKQLLDFILERLK